MKPKIGKALVVGAGVAGIRAALDLAETGYRVTLIDRAPHIGGILSQLDHQFPSDGCGMCRMLPLVDRDSGSQYCLRKGLFHRNIDILLSTEILSVSGEPGHYEVALKERPSWVDPDRCTGCGVCIPACPVDVPDAFNAGMSSRKAIYLPVPHAVPNPYIIDLAACTRCGACAAVCPTGAVRLPEAARRRFRVLVVDDEQVVRESVQAWLEEEGGFSVTTAASGPEALACLDTDTFHLMMLDIKMPEMDGVDVLRAALEKAPGLDVVMMTAYAAVDTAVEAMKLGALDYLIKPFDPDALTTMVIARYEDFEAARGRKLDVGAVVLCGGTVPYDPAGGRDTMGYGTLPDVVTNLQFERLMSGTGPTGGALRRPSDGRPIRRIAWLQCVGSRDLQSDADYCSTLCCMAAIKEARLARAKIGSELAAHIFFMDMRTCGKGFQRYRDQAEAEDAVAFVRGRVHSVVRTPATGDLMLRYTEAEGATDDLAVDLVVLSVGQRPAPQATAMAQALDLGLNPWGFVETEPFSLTRVANGGIFLGGSFAGPADIAETVIQASAAALGASAVIHATGGGLAEAEAPGAPARDLAFEIPRVMVALCTCGERVSSGVDMDALTEDLRSDPAVIHLAVFDRACTAEGWTAVANATAEKHPNRLLLGACRPLSYAKAVDALSQKVGLPKALIDAVDITWPAAAEKAAAAETTRHALSALRAGLARLKHADPRPPETRPVAPSALVLGGGIAGMSAALAIADHGFPVDLVEAAGTLGGNLQWLSGTLGGADPAPLLADVCERVEKHPRVTVHANSRLIHAAGQVGAFTATIEDNEGRVAVIDHGVAVLATGGREAETTSYGHGEIAGVVTQRAFEQTLAGGDVGLAPDGSVVMILCVDSREAPRNYCSRVCCPTAIKHALRLKDAYPDLSVTILYRDIMTTGFLEHGYTEARRRGVLFIRYTPERKPVVSAGGSEAGARRLQVAAWEPVVGRPVCIDADTVVLATGVTPALPPEVAAAYGAACDTDGFFLSAETKWRPVAAMAEGVFACGLCHSPRPIDAAIASAEAAAQRALSILSKTALPAAAVSARVRDSLCALCLQCIDACPYGARQLSIDESRIEVHPAMCQGCGACAAVCPSGAATLEGLSKPAMMEMIEAVF